MSKEHQIVDISGAIGNNCNSPVAVMYKQETEFCSDLVVDPIFNDSVERNLYGRIMTLVEATTDSYKLKAVKDLFSKEIKEWSSYVYESARDIANINTEHIQHMMPDNNIYTR